MKKLLFFLCLLPSLFLQAQTSFSIYDTLHVAHNELHFDMRDFKGGVLRGSANISIESKREHLDFAPLLLLRMQIDSVLVNGVRTDQYQYNDTLLRIPLDPALRKGEKATLSIAYHGKPISSYFGGFAFYDKLQIAHNMGVSLDAIPHSFGRGWFPATDDFRSRTTFDLYFKVTNDKKAIGSGLLKETLPAENNSTIWHWVMNQPIPDYLVSVAVGDYRKIQFEHQQSKRMLPIDIYVLPNEVESAKECYSIIPDVLSVMESHFGEYQFDRVGYVSVNSPGGAMEHVANISMPRNPRPTMGYRELAIHELIHAWFGNRVTCATAGDMWLNEGTTTYCPEIVLKELFSDKEEKRYRQSFQRAALLSAPMSEGYLALAGMPETNTYGTTVYQKGAWVIRALRMYLGDDRFFPAMRDYLKEYTFRHATTKDFENYLTRHTGVDLEDFFQLHVYQPGFVAFEIDSVVVQKKDKRYQGTVYVEQKLCHAPQYAQNFRLPVSFFGAKGECEKHYLSVSGAHSTCQVTLAFKPVYSIIDVDQELCKGSLYDDFQIDSVGNYPSRLCPIELTCNKMKKPFVLHTEYYSVAPDQPNASSAWSLSDTHYWRVAGLLPSRASVKATFQINKRMKDAQLLSAASGKIYLLYRPDQSADWIEVASLAVDEKTNRENITVDKVKCGEYCLAVRK